MEAGKHFSEKEATPSCWVAEKEVTPGPGRVPEKEETPCRSQETEETPQETEETPCRSFLEGELMINLLGRISQCFNVFSSSVQTLIGIRSVICQLRHGTSSCVSSLV